MAYTGFPVEAIGFLEGCRHAGQGGEDARRTDRGEVTLTADVGTSYRFVIFRFRWGCS